MESIEGDWISIYGGNSMGIMGVRIIVYFFFFQAEDGIRDRCVPGVQTCALPIWGWGLNLCIAMVCCVLSCHNPNTINFAYCTDLHTFYILQ